MIKNLPILEKGGPTYSSHIREGYFEILFHILNFCFQAVGIDPDIATGTSSIDDLEAELEKDLGDLNLGDVDTTDVNLDDEDLLD